MGKWDYVEGGRTIETGTIQVYSIQRTKNELLPVGHDSMTGLVVYIIETMN